MSLPTLPRRPASLWQALALLALLFAAADIVLLEYLLRAGLSLYVRIPVVFVVLNLLVALAGFAGVAIWEQRHGGDGGE